MSADWIVPALFAALLAGAALGVFVARLDAAATARKDYERGRASRDAEVEILRGDRDAAYRLLDDWRSLCSEMVKRLTEHRVRVERHEAGLPEIEVTREPKVKHPMTEELRRFIADFRSEASRRHLMDRANAMLYDVPSDEVLRQFKLAQGADA